MLSGTGGLVLLLLIGQYITVFGLGEFVVHDGCFGDGISLVVEGGDSWYSSVTTLISAQRYFLFIYIGLDGIVSWEPGG